MYLGPIDDTNINLDTGETMMASNVGTVEVKVDFSNFQKFGAACEQAAGGLRRFQAAYEKHLAALGPWTCGQCGLQHTNDSLVTCWDGWQGCGAARTDVDN